MRYLDTYVPRMVIEMVSIVSRWPFDTPRTRFYFLKLRNGSFDRLWGSSLSYRTSIIICSWSLFCIWERQSINHALVSPCHCKNKKVVKFRQAAVVVVVISPPPPPPTGWFPAMRQYWCPCMPLVWCTYDTYVDEVDKKSFFRCLVLCV